jgi:hypothetical protein
VSFSHIGVFTGGDRDFDEESKSPNEKRSNEDRVDGLGAFCGHVLLDQSWTQICKSTYVLLAYELQLSWMQCIYCNPDRCILAAYRHTYM